MVEALVSIRRLRTFLTLPQHANAWAEMADPSTSTASPSRDSSSRSVGAAAAAATTAEAAAEFKPPSRGQQGVTSSSHQGATSSSHPMSPEEATSVRMQARAAAVRQQRAVAERRELEAEGAVALLEGASFAWRQVGVVAGAGVMRGKAGLHLFCSLNPSQTE